MGAQQRGWLTERQTDHEKACNEKACQCRLISQHRDIGGIGPGCGGRGLPRVRAEVLLPLLSGAALQPGLSGALFLVRHLHRHLTRLYL